MLRIPCIWLLLLVLFNFFFWKILNSVGGMILACKLPVYVGYDKRKYFYFLYLLSALTHAPPTHHFHSKNMRCPLGTTVVASFINGCVCKTDVVYILSFFRQTHYSIVCVATPFYFLSSHHITFSRCFQSQCSTCKMRKPTKNACTWKWQMQSMYVWMWMWCVCVPSFIWNLH